VCLILRKHDTSLLKYTAENSSLESYLHASFLNCRDQKGSTLTKAFSMWPLRGWFCRLLSVIINLLLAAVESKVFLAGL